MRVNIISCVVLLLSVTISASAQLRSYTVTGRVVDDDMQPVARAGLVLFPLHELPSGPFATNFTDPSGRFSIKEQPRVVKNWNLFVTALAPGCSNKEVGFDPPFYQLSSHDEAFQGIPIVFGNKEVIDLGEVRVKFWYGDLNIKLLQRGKELSHAQWMNVWYEIVDINGNFVAARSVAPVLDEVDLANSILKLSMPVGTWAIRFQKYDNGSNELDERIYGHSSFFSIRKNPCSIALNVSLDSDF